MGHSLDTSFRIMTYALLALIFLLCHSPPIVQLSKSQIVMLDRLMGRQSSCTTIWQHSLTLHCNTPMRSFFWQISRVSDLVLSLEHVSTLGCSQVHTMNEHNHFRLLILRVIQMCEFHVNLHTDIWPLFGSPKTLGYFDWGSTMIRDWKNSHICNSLCERLGLPMI